MRHLLQRMTALMLSALLFIGCGAQMAFAEEGAAESAVTSAAESSALEAMELLRTLGIIGDYHDYNVSMGEEISRAEFVEAAARLAGMEAYTEGEGYFYDVPQSHWCYGSIGAMTAAGILNGNGSKVFQPDEPILKVDAIKILLSLMGYGKYADALGGYPSGYLLAAKRIGLSEQPADTDKLTRMDLFLLLKEAGTIGMFEGDTFKEDEVTYKVSSETLLSVHHNVYQKFGIVTGANGLAFDGTAMDKDGEVRIDDVRYRTELDLYGYLGESVEYFYTQQKSGDTGNIIWLSRNGETETITVTADHDASFNEDTYQLTYTPEGKKERTVTLSREGVWIYNGGKTAQIGDHLNEGRYTAKLVKSGSGAYDVVIVSAYRDFVVKSVDADKEEIYFKNGASLNINTYSRTFTSIQTAGGNAAGIDEIKKDQVLSLAQSEDLEYLYLVISDKQVLGTLSQLREEANGRYLTIDGQVYYHPNENVTEAYRVGDALTVSLNAFSEVAYVTSVSGGTSAAYLIEGKVESENGFGKVLNMKVLAESGEIKTVTCASKVVLDGEKITDVSVLYQKLSDEYLDLKHQLVLIKTNESGKITAIDTAAPAGTTGESAGTLRVDCPMIKSAFWMSFNIGGKIPMNSSTKVFLVPGGVSGVPLSEARDEDYIVLTSRTQISDNYQVDAESYTVKERSSFPEYVVVHHNLRGYSTSGATPILVKDVVQSVDSEGNLIEKIIGYKGKSEVEMVADEDISFIEGKADESSVAISKMIVKPGDLVDVLVGRDGKVWKYNIKYSVNALDTYSSLSNLWVYYVGVSGKVHDVVDTVLKVDLTDDGVDSADLIENIGSSTAVLVCDLSKRETEVRLGKLDEAKEGDSVYVEFWEASPNLVVLYKK